MSDKALACRSPVPPETQRLPHAQPAAGSQKILGQTSFCIETRCSAPPVPGTEEDNTPSHGLLRCRELMQGNALTASMDVLVPNRNESRVECHGRGWGIRLLCSKSKDADDRDNRRRP